MARTGKGNLTGKAAATELREQRERLLDAERLAREVREIEDENDAIRRCVVLEGEVSFYRWWNDDAQVPPFGGRTERIEMIEQRIRFLTTPLHTASVPNEKADGEKSQ